MVEHNRKNLSLEKPSDTFINYTGSYYETSSTKRYTYLVLVRISTRFDGHNKIISKLLRKPSTSFFLFVYILTYGKSFIP